jgi:hypothetical protein
VGNRKKKDKKKALKHRFAKPTPPGGPEDRPVVLFEPAGAVKMSEVLLDFLAPYEDQWETPNDLRRLATLAMVAWNAANATGKARADLLETAATSVPPELRDEFLTIILGMMQRKLMHFDGNKRMILDVKVTELPDGSPYLAVMSTLPR